ncbi:hypothetical protein BDB00DRAFT_871262 [Zychaea mexicana]|uniref:uncharacterized protein n=1 Tax=Zychaea mexicana TaxID=64656 RepID=UPI0022FE6F06|nr:uncharacterized protein BDB00DRAFT_871262 [Zychaea mexicana]KAI9494716.1 hypothetical protein BDB00DRAFT_871262 [Zychaea mexicana]
MDQQSTPAVTFWEMRLDDYDLGFAVWQVPGCSSKVVLLTGGSSGLGRVAVKRFVSEGHTVIFTGRSADRLDETVAWINSSQEVRARLHTHVLDLENLESIRKGVELLKSLGLSLDVWINNAGRTTINLEYVPVTSKVEKTIFANAIGPW